jgi:hypothetical protein
MIERSTNVAIRLISRFSDLPWRDIGRQCWSVLNSPIIIAILSVLVVKFGADYYSRRVAEFKDRDDRQKSLTSLLTEFNQRVWDLSQDDGAIGSNSTNKPAPSLATKTIAGRIEKDEIDVLTGGGTYHPTSPAYAGVSLINLMGQIDFASNVHDLDYSYIGALPFLDDRSSWISVRTLLPDLRSYAIGRQQLLLSGDLPLRWGQRLNPAETAALHDPLLPWADKATVDRHIREGMERLKAETKKIDELARRVAGS